MDQTASLSPGWTRNATRIEEPDDGPPVMDRVVVVLCRAEGAMNVGATCRAAMTMGIRRLSLVACPDYDDDIVRMHALAAWPLYLGARRCASLDEALADVSIAAGFTRRTGERRKRSIDVQAFADMATTRFYGTGAERQQIALVFGNERNGLSDEELASCNLAVHIDTDRSFPSLNLSHAVQLACWELRNAGSEALKARNATGSGTMTVNGAVADRAAVAATVRVIVDALKAAGLYRRAGEAGAVRRLSDLLSRAGASDEELRWLEKLAIRLGAVGSKHAGHGGPPDPEYRR